MLKNVLWLLAIVALLVVSISAALDTVPSDQIKRDIEDSVGALLQLIDEYFEQEPMERPI